MTDQSTDILGTASEAAPTTATTQPATQETVQQPASQANLFQDKLSAIKNESVTYFLKPGTLNSR